MCFGICWLGFGIFLFICVIAWWWDMSCVVFWYFWFLVFDIGLFVGCLCGFFFCGAEFFMCFDSLSLVGVLWCCFFLDIFLLGLFWN